MIEVMIAAACGWVGFEVGFWRASRNAVRDRDLAYVAGWRARERVSAGAVRPAGVDVVATSWRLVDSEGREVAR